MILPTMRVLLIDSKNSNLMLNSFIRQRNIEIIVIIGCLTDIFNEVSIKKVEWIFYQTCTLCAVQLSMFSQWGQKFSVFSVF